LEHFPQAINTNQAQFLAEPDVRSAARLTSKNCCVSNLPNSARLSMQALLWCACLRSLRPSCS